MQKTNPATGDIFTVELLNVKPLRITVGAEQSIIGLALNRFVKSLNGTLNASKLSISVSVYPPPPILASIYVLS